MNVRKMFRRCKKRFWRNSCIEDRWLLFFLYQFSFSKIKANYNFLITYSPYIFDEFYPFSFRPSIYWSLILQVFLQKILYTVFIRGSCRRHTHFAAIKKVIIGYCKVRWIWVWGRTNQVNCTGIFLKRPALHYYEEEQHFSFDALHTLKLTLKN